MICEKCKHYFKLHISWFDDFHNACNEEFCYLCADKYNSCAGYEEGDVPEGEIRGEEEYDRAKRLGEEF